MLSSRFLRYWKQINSLYICGSAIIKTHTSTAMMLWRHPPQTALCGLIQITSNKDHMHNPLSYPTIKTLCVIFPSAFSYQIRLSRPLVSLIWVNTVCTWSNTHVFKPSPTQTRTQSRPGIVYLKWQPAVFIPPGLLCLSGASDTVV